MRILTAADVAEALTMREAIAAMRSAFAQLSSGAAVVPARTATPTGGGVTLTMPAYLPDGALSVKVVSVNPHNPAVGLATIQGAVLVLDPRTAVPLALIEGRSLTALRTGAATGLATDLLARPDARILTIFGAGGQSAQQIAGVCAVREIEEVRVVRRGETADFDRVDIIVTATNSAVPVFRDPPAGVHINAIGSYRPDMRELDEATMAAAKVVVDSREHARAEAGELQRDTAIHAELGEVVLGKRPGRTGRDEITVFKSVGNAAQDAAIARAILAGAEARGLGQIFDFG
jgi:ornithine cyclodeaminase/alanine dehydrogenase-like protein (mu-crystallin family)